MKVFGIGFPKTGTTTLESILSLLGKRHCVSHWDKANTNFLIHAWKTQDFDELKRVIKCYDAFADGPWGGTELYKFLFKEYPKDKFILTEREAENWFNSLKNMSSRFLVPDDDILDVSYYAGMYGFVNWIEHFFEVPTISDKYKDKIIKKYLSTNQNIKDEAKAKNIDLLIVNTTDLSHWDKVCNFLNETPPAIPIPRSNTGVAKGQFSIPEAIMLIRYYLTKKNIDAAKQLFNKISQLNINTIEISSLAKQIDSAQKTRDIMMIK